MISRNLLRVLEVLVRGDFRSGILSAKLVGWSLFAAVPGNERQHAGDHLDMAGGDAVETGFVCIFFRPTPPATHPLRTTVEVR